MNIEEQKVYYDNLWGQQKKLNNLKLRRSIKILEYFVVVKKKFHTPKILDLGCGEGRFASFVGEFGFADGIELSEKAVEKAKELYPHVNFFQANILEYPFNENSYDVVISQEVIEHFEDQELYINVCHKVLKKGGYLILTTPNKRILDHMKNGDKWSNQPIENVLTPFDLKTLVSKKFKILDYDSIILNFGDKGIYKLINYKYFIGASKVLGLNELREYFLGKLGFGLHQCILARKDG